MTATDIAEAARSSADGESVDVTGVIMNEVNAQVRSSLLGGLIAAVIFMVIATLTDGSKGFVVAGGLGLLVFTFVVSMIISKSVHRNR